MPLCSSVNADRLKTSSSSFRPLLRGFLVILGGDAGFEGDGQAHWRIETKLSQP